MLDSIRANGLTSRNQSDVDFRVVLIGDANASKLTDALFVHEVPVLAIPVTQFGRAILQLRGYERMVLTPASAVLSTGGIWTSPIVLQTALLARSEGVEVTVASEMIKLVQWKSPGGDNSRSTLNWQYDRDEVSCKFRGNLLCLIFETCLSTCPETFAS